MRTRSSSKPFDPAFEEQKLLVLPDIGQAISLDDDAFVTSLYSHVASESAIDTFLKQSRFYNLTHRRWKMPRSCAKLFDSDICTPFLNICSSILKHFMREAGAQGTRQVVDTHSTDLLHREADGVTHHSRPSLVVKAEGPSFQLPHAGPGERSRKLGYSNVASCIEIHTNGNELPISDQLVRVAIYARQIFIHQPNRRFVRALVMSESHIRLFHFDRSGVQYSQLVDFHDDPHTFVRLVLGLSSSDELDIGLDTSIQWTIENGRKVGGTIRTHGPDNQDITYPLGQIEPIFFRGNIRGRSTTCWRVRDPANAEQLIVKDSWRSEDRISEHIYLQQTVGVPGVVQMVNCEPDRCETRNLRAFGDAVPGGYRNRIESRIVMKTYGKSVEEYTSAKQLMCALRDAIGGHKGLFKKGTLHRDVSPHNVLLGKPGADPGDRGILIDFDIAVQRSLKTPANWQIGTRLYQSVAVLNSCTVPHPLPHDHLDDLESFLYILVHLMFTYDSNGVAHPIDETLIRWDAEGDDCRMAAMLKEAYLTRDFVPPEVEARWPSPCIDLIIALNGFIYPIMRKKMKLDQLTPAIRKRDEKALASEAIQHYTHILQLFDTAIEALDKPDTWRVADSGEVPPDALSSGSSSSDSSLENFLRKHQNAHQSHSERSPNLLKRASDGSPDGQPPAKRSKSPGGGRDGSSSSSSSSNISTIEPVPRRRTRRSARNLA